jgi:hypothetical protein
MVADGVVYNASARVVVSAESVVLKAKGVEAEGD